MDMVILGIFLLVSFLLLAGAAVAMHALSPYGFKTPLVLQELRPYERVLLNVIAIYPFISLLVLMGSPLYGIDYVMSSCIECFLAYGFGHVFLSAMGMSAAWYLRRFHRAYDVPLVGCALAGSVYMFQSLVLFID